MRTCPYSNRHQIWPTERGLERQRMGVRRRILSDGRILHRKRSHRDLCVNGQSRVERLELGQLAGVPPDEGVLGARAGS